MTEIKEMIEFKITENTKELASEITDEVTYQPNKTKVYFEELCRIIFTRFLYNQENLSFKIINTLPDDDQGINRRELFPLNIINVDGIFFYLINTGTGSSGKIFIPRKIFNSKLAPDYYVPLRIDNSGNKISIPGFISYENILKEAKVHSDDYYFVSEEKLTSLDELTACLTGGINKQEKTGLEDEDSFDEEEIKEEFKEYLDSIENDKYPENFPEGINMSDSSFYYALLYSELLSGEYLNLQQRISQLKPISSGEISKINLSSVYLFHKKIAQINSFRKFAAAKTSGKSNLIVYEFNLKDNTLNEIKENADILINNDDHELTVRGLKNYSGKKWLLFSDITGTVIPGPGFESAAEVFKNWNENFFTKIDEGLKDKIYVNCSSSEDDTIERNGYLDIRLDEQIELPESAYFYLAIIKEG